MSTLHYSRNLLVALTLATLVGCASAPKKTAESVLKPTPSKLGGYYLDDGPGDNPPDIAAIPDAVPVKEPLHRAANRPYTVFGKTYVPNVSNEPFRQNGIASWYGRKFHGQKTSIGEIYDMYGMTAAHPTLPLPCYVRVSNANGKAVIVRVNDRGPFHGERIIDLSYSAAAKLGIAGPGSGVVTVERIFPGVQVTATAPPPTPASSAAVMPQPLLPQPLTSTATPISSEKSGIFIQLGAFSAAQNADSFRDKMQRDLDWMREPLSVVYKDGLHRVRIGPLSNQEEALAIADKVRSTMNISPVVTSP